jgi:calcineurin-like phosphoesterase family protein
MDYFISDTHHSHGNIIKYCKRPFMSDKEVAELDACSNLDRNAVRNVRISQATIDYMNQTMIDNINAVVGEDDTLWHIGDVGWFKDFSQAERWRDRIFCRNINLIWGNHDEEFIAPLFNKVWDQVKIKVSGQDIVLNHYPMANWDKKHHGSWHLYGHCHGTHEKWRKEHMPDSFCFDVGVDCWGFKPLSFKEVSATMKQIANSRPDRKAAFT